MVAKMGPWYFMNFTRRETDKVDLDQLSQYDVDELIRKGGWRLIGGVGGGRHDPINPIIYPPPFDHVGR